MLARLRHRAFLFVNLPEQRFALRTRLLRPWWTRRFAAFGKDTIFVRPRSIRGGHKITIGSNCLIWPDCTLSVERPVWEVEGPRLTIGDGVLLQSNTLVSCAERIEIADHVTFGPNCLISDNDHTRTDAAESVLFNPVISAPVRIGRGAWIGHNCAVIRGASIGDYAVIGANSVVRSEIPPYSIAVGAPARVVGQVPFPGSPHQAQADALT